MEHKYESKTDQILRELANPFPNTYPGEEASWYYIETLSECNLQCGLCAIGSREIFHRKKGMIDLELFKKIIDKIAIESPHALISPFHHSEPMLHPDFPEMIRVIKEHGLTSMVATNLNYPNRMEDVIDAGVDILSISVSGFYQETYQKSHIHGNIEKVKENLRELRRLIDCSNKKPAVSVNYHMYKDNLGDDFDKMEEFCTTLGFAFNPSWARSISIEMTLKYLREKGLSRYKGQTLQWFDEIPPLTKKYYDSIERLVYLPEDYLAGKYADIHGDECPQNHRVIHIKWNGKVFLCPCAFDDRFITTFDYLSTPIEKLYEMKRNSLICKECLENNFDFYANYLDMPGIDHRASGRLGADTPNNRRFFAVPDSPHDKIYDFCKAHDHIFIFGAGGNGRIITDILNAKNMKYDYYLVSDEHIAKYDNENIKPLSFLLNGDYQNAGIIVALNPQNTDEVRDMLEKTGIDLCLSYQYL